MFFGGGLRGGGRTVSMTVRYLCRDKMDERKKKGVNGKKNSGLISRCRKGRRHVFPSPLTITCGTALYISSSDSSVAPVDQDIPASGRAAFEPE